MPPELCPLPAGQGAVPSSWGLSRVARPLSHVSRASSCVSTWLQGPRGPQGWGLGLGRTAWGGQPGEDSHHCPHQQVWRCQGKLQGRGQDPGEVTARLVCTASPSSAGPWQWKVLTARSCFAADAAADHGSLHLPRQLPEPGRRLLPVPHPADRGRQSQRAASHSHCTSVR